MNSYSINRTFKLIFVKATLNLQSEASVNYLSYAWWVMEPLLHMAVYYTVFGLGLRGGGEDFAVFLLSGLIPWLWFVKSITHAQRSILQGKQLMNQLFIPKWFFPMTLVFQDSIKQIFVFALLLIFLYLNTSNIFVTWLWIFPLILIQFFLIIGCCLLAAVIVPFVRDFSFVISTGLQFMMFGSGIFYNYTRIPEEYHQIFFLNPMAIILNAFRDVLLYGHPPNIQQLFYVVSVSVVIVTMSAFLYRKLEYILPKVVLE
jgi:homopolymeric O-antigen transport system permease protein